MKVDSFVFYTSWLEAVEELDEETQLNTLKAILKYQAFHEESDIKGVSLAIFKMAKPIIDDMYSRRIASIENGKKGGRPKAAQSTEIEDKAEGSLKPKNLEKPSNNPPFSLGYSEKNLNENENDNGNENENANSKRFKPPTLEEVREYCLERNNNVDPKQFYDYFSTGKWKDSKGNPVRNWKQKIITWERYNPTKKEPEEEKLPEYDESINVQISESELNSILQEMRKRA